MNMKKLASLLLALVLVLAMAVPAMAAMEGDMTGGSITITNPVEGQTYSAYQILYLESYNEASGAYAYKANSAWAAWLATQTSYVTIDTQGYVTWVEGADVKEFAKLAQAQLEGKTADATATAGETVVLPNLKLGYYLVDTTLGTICSLDTTNPTVEMEEKNEVPEVKKEVEEDSDNTWGDVNDADINQVVNYKATITVQKGAENYVLYDNMSAGLTFNNDVKVFNGEVEVLANNYNVSTNVTVGEGEEAVTYDFAVTFDNEYIAGLADGTQLVVKYSATLNENAVVGNAGNPNDVILKYGDSTKPSWTPKDTTITYTWDMDVVKYTTKTETVDGTTTTTEIMLKDAKFKLCTDDAGNNAIKFHTVAVNEYEVCADANCDKAHVTEITTDATGKFSIEGLDAGTYYLIETAAPAGYNKLADPVEVKIEATESEKGDKLSYETIEKKVLNQTGAELPETGGMGTTLLYVGGGILVLGAVIVLITKKRMTAR